MTLPVLSVRALRKAFAPRTRGGSPLVAVDGVDLDVLPGEVVGLVGESGSGKTTLGKLLLRIIEPDSGRIQLLGRDLRAASATELRGLRRHAQMIYQSASASLNPGMTVDALLRETLALHRPDLASGATEVIAQTLARFRLDGRGARRSAELSGGERRRVAVARCLLPDPDLVVADEPTAGLDASVKADVLRVMLSGRTPTQAFIFVSHELDVVRYVSDRVLVMFRGTIVEELPATWLDPARAGLVHPYTERLLSAALGGERPVIRPLGPPVVGSACRYLGPCHLVDPRSSSAQRCRTERPELRSHAPGHRLACHWRPPSTKAD